QDDELLAYSDEKTRQRFEAYRSPLHSHELSLWEICEQENLRLAVDQIHFYNRFVTPLGRPRRFDTRFFIAQAPPGQTGQHDDNETVDSIWISPIAALELHAAKEFDLMNVTRKQLEVLAGFESKEALIGMAANNEHFPVHRPVLPT
ncbi:MAG: NUDIX hydrolase, partial [Gammaproteobacteria bacterium]|nr:NUDIX hydrolase [Gammaproteobacteria bacterium]